MKKRMLATLLTICMVLALIPSVAFAATSTAQFLVINETRRVSGNSSYSVTAATMENVLKIIAGTQSFPPPPFGSGANLDTTSPVVIKLLNTDSTTLDQDLTVTNRLYQIGLTSIVNTHDLQYTHNVALTGKISVGENGILVLTGSDIVSNGHGHANVAVSSTIEVNEGGRLYIECNPRANLQNQNDIYTSQTGEPIIKVNGGTLHIGSTELVMPENSTSPAILVESGTVIIHEKTAGYYLQQGSSILPDYEAAKQSTYGARTVVTTSGVPAIEVKSGGDLTVDGGTYTTTGEASSVVVESGASLTLNGGVFATDEKAAISVAPGAKLVIPKDTTVHVTTENENEKAIDLAVGSTVEMEAMTIVVGGGEGESYVDNDGVIHLAANSKVNDTVLENGGTVDTEGNLIEPVASVTLDKDNLSLYPGGTAQLTAMVTPDNAADTVTWTSSDTNIATVDADGVVTAVGYGTATITATVGGKTATCTVTVAYPYIPVPPVNPTQPTKPAEPDQPDEPDTPVIPGALPFVDVSANDWYYEDVAYVYAQGIMTGSTASTFAPSDAMTRAMVWTVLGRMSGEDVEGGTPWYALAQSWAVSAGVSDGTGPNDSITREQLVTMLYRQAGSPEVGVSELALLGRFADGEAVSSWAEEAMAWAVSQGVLTGDGNLLNPQATATRAQVAAILARYCENIQK